MITSKMFFTFIMLNLLRCCSTERHYKVPAPLEAEGLMMKGLDSIDKMFPAFTATKVNFKVVNLSGKLHITPSIICVHIIIFVVVI